MTVKKDALFLRVSPEVNLKLKNKAETLGLSLNAYCVSLLKESQTSSLELFEGEFLSVIENAKKLFKENLKAVIVFGSWARGEETSESDLDILLVLDDNIKISRDLYRIWEENTKLDDKLSIHFSQLQKNSLSGFWCEIAIDGIVIYDDGLEVSKHLIMLREKILSGDYYAKFSHGHRYWLLKEAA